MARIARYSARLRKLAAEIDELLDELPEDDTNDMDVRVLHRIGCPAVRDPGRLCDCVPFLAVCFSGGRDD